MNDLKGKTSGVITAEISAAKADLISGASTTLTTDSSDLITINVTPGGSNAFDFDVADEKTALENYDLPQNLLLLLPP